MISESLFVHAIGWVAVGAALAITTRSDAKTRTISDKHVRMIVAASCVLFLLRVAAAAAFGDVGGFVWYKNPGPIAAIVFYMCLFQAVSYACFCFLVMFLYRHQKYIKLGGGDVKVLCSLAICLPLHHMLCLFAGTFLAAMFVLISAAVVSGDYSKDGTLRDLVMLQRSGRSPYLLFVFISFTIYVLIMTFEKLGLWPISWRFW